MTYYYKCSATKPWTPKRAENYAVLRLANICSVLQKVNSRWLSGLVYERKEGREDNMSGLMNGWIDKGMDGFKNRSSGNDDWENLHEEEENQAKLLKVNHMTISWLCACIILSFFLIFIDELHDTSLFKKYSKHIAD